MKFLLIYTLLSLTFLQTPANLQEHSGLEVVSLEVKEIFHSHDFRPSMVSSQPPVIKPDLNRGPDRNEPEIQKIERDRNDRARDLASLKNVKREDPYRPKIIPVYLSQAQMKNGTAKSIKRFVWAYRASPGLQYAEDQEIVCDVKIRPGDTKLIKVEARYPRQNIVNVSASSANSIPEKPSLKDLVINQVMFADGSTWQRPNWKPPIISKRVKQMGKGKCLAL